METLKLIVQVVVCLAFVAFIAITTLKALSGTRNTPTNDN